MLRMNLLLSGLATLALAVGLSGCAGANKGNAKPDNAKQDSHAEEGSHAGHDQGGGKYAEELAKLSPADRAAAEKQKICPVSKQPLGSMGVPYKLEVKGRTVFLCCQGCEGEIKSDPDKYFAELDKK